MANTGRGGGPLECLLGASVDTVATFFLGDYRACPINAADHRPCEPGIVIGLYRDRCGPLKGLLTTAFGTLRRSRLNLTTNLATYRR